MFHEPSLHSGSNQPFKGLAFPAILSEMLPHVARTFRTGEHLDRTLGSVCVAQDKENSSRVKK